MQQPNVKSTITDGVITIAPGVERIEEGAFIEVDFKEMYVPASVKVIEYPLDLSEELEADLYLYGSDTAIAFSKEAMWRVVKARIYVMPELQADYEERLDRTLQGNWRELISVEAMPADKMSHYGPIEQPQRTPLTPSEAAKFEAIEHERQLLEEQWNTQCAQPYAVALSELQAEEEVFKTSIRIVKRKAWQFPFFSKPNPRKARSRILFHEWYYDGLVRECDETAARMAKVQDELSRLIRRDDNRTPQSAIRRMRQLLGMGRATLEKGMEQIKKIDSLIKELRADLLKQTVKPTFSLKRTLITIGILLSVCLPLTARLIDSPVVDDVCLKLWGIVLIAFCIYFVWWLDDFVLVVTEHSDGSVEYREERMSELKKSIFYKVFYH